MRAAKVLLTASTVFVCAGLASAAMAQVTINGGGATSSQPTYDGEFTAYTQSTPSVLFSYDGVGSVGQTAFLTNNIALFNKPTNQYGTIVGTTVHFAASDSPLTATQVSGYTLASSDGALIQLPTIGVGLTIPYVNAALAKLTLTDAQLCGVFSGKITSWKTLNPKATTGTIELVYRSDSAAATFLLTQHLAAVCTASNSSFPTLPVVPTLTFASLFTASGGTVPGTFVGVSGSSGMASTLLASSLGIGYVSPDYTSVAPKSSNTTKLLVASLTNATNGKAYLPTVANIVLGLDNAGAGSINATPPATKSAAANPLNWVPSIPVTKSGYSIVGYSSWDISTCYATASIGTTIANFLTLNYTNAAYKTIITNAGATPLANTHASPYVTAVTNTFLNNKSKYNLNIGNATACKGLPGR